MSTITSPRPPPPQTQHPPPTPQSPITSSARSSLSIDRGASGSTPRRNRTALRDYYKLATTGPSSSVSSPVATSTLDLDSPPLLGHSSANPLLRALDTPDFSAEEWVRKLLRTASLEELLRVEAALVGEIGGADGERKALVYDNYSKLIDATETIRKMRVKMDEGDGVDGADEKRAGSGLGIRTAGGGEMGAGGGGGGGGINVRAKVGPMIDTIEKLARSVAAVAGDAAAAQKESVVSAESDKGNDSEVIQQAIVDGSEHKNPSEHQSVDVTTQQKQRQQQTVQWVLDAPVRLEQLVKDGKREEAETDWTKVSALLEKWKGVSGVEDIKRAAEEVMK